MASKVSINRQRLNKINKEISNNRARYTLGKKAIKEAEIEGGTPFVTLEDETKIAITFKNLKELHDVGSTERQ